MSESVYLQGLQSPNLGLIAPLPLEVTGKSGNYVATWLEGQIEGDGPTSEEAVEDCRTAVIDRFVELRTKLTKQGSLEGTDEQVWHSLLHFIVEAGKRSLQPGEEYESSPGDDDYKGPIFG